MRPSLSLLRRHWLFAALFAAGAALRLDILVAYQPALEFFQDSYEYLYNAQHLVPDVIRPAGYPLLLRILSLSGHLATVPLTQHLMGLAATLLVYVLLMRMGVAPWLAALGTAPMLLDTLQLVVEQMVMAETLATLLIVVAFSLVLGRRDSPMLAVALAGLCLAAATLTRTASLPLFVPLALYVAVRLRLTRALVLAATFALPVLLYATWFHSVHGQFALEAYDGYILAGRVDPFANCATVPVQYQRLCTPEVNVKGVSWYIWFYGGPVEQLPAHGVGDRDSFARSYALGVIRRQPGDYVASVGQLLTHYFAPNRQTGGSPYDYDYATYLLYEQAPPIAHIKMHPPPDIYASGWPMRPSFGPDRNNMIPAVYGFQGQVLYGVVHPRAARPLVAYQRFGVTPGPLLALGVVAGLLAPLFVLLEPRGRRYWEAGLGAFTLSLGGLSLLVMASATSLFDFRYLVPALPLISAGGVLGLSVVGRSVAAIRERRGRGLTPALTSPSQPEPRISTD